MSTTTGSNAPLSQLNDTPAELSTGLVRFKHIILALLLSVVFFLVFCFIALHAYIAWVLSNPTVAPLYSNPKLAKDMNYENVTFHSIDGKRNINGWYIPAENSSKTIVLSHGYGANREETWVPMYDIAHYAHNMNFNVLMFDYGFASQTSKEVATGGKEEKRQLLGAIEHVKQREADCRLGFLHGCRYCSPGGA